MPTFNTTDPKPGYVYDASDDTWYPLAGIATQTLDGLTDVVITSASTNQVLSFNGTNWVNSSEAGDIASVTAGTGLTGGGSTGALTLSLDTTSAYVLPSQTSNSGKYLTTNGSAASWGSITTDPLPSVFLLGGM